MVPSAQASRAALAAHAAALADHDLRALFAADPSRSDRLHLDAAGWHLDYGKQR
jgi:glucose-6-phosphate isomerase